MNKLIMIYSEEFFPTVGGGELYVKDLAISLANAGKKVIVLTSSNKAQDEELPFKVVKLHHSIPLYGFNVNFLEVLNVVRKYKPCVFHVSGPTNLDYILLPILKVIGLKLIVTFHGQFNAKIGKLIASTIGRFSYRFADIIISQSERDVDFLSNMGLPVNKISKFYFNGIDVQKFNCPKNIVKKSNNFLDQPFTFIFIGGITSSRPYKGVENLISTFKKLCARYTVPEIVLKLVGDGDLLPMLEKTAHKYKNIRFLGGMSEKKLIAELCKSDALILPSISDGEGFGRVVLEAISCGVPVLVSKYAGISELISRYDAGLIYDPKDVEGAVSKLLTFVRNRQNLKPYVKKAFGMLTMEGLDLTSTVQRTIDIYEEFDDEV